MALDPSIYRAIEQPQQVNPLAQLAQVAGIQGAQQQNRLAQLQMQEYERARTQDAAQRDALIAAGNDPKAIGQAYLSQGNAKGYLDYQKGQADLGKTAAETRSRQLETASKQVELAGQAFGFVRANPTLENANAAIDALMNNGVWDAPTAAQYKAQVAANPGAIAQLADQAYRSALSAKDQLANYQTRNTGGTTDTISIDPVTGQTRVTNSVRNTQSPDSVASTAVQMRGQNMVDARQRENNQNGRVPSGYRAKGDGTLEFIPGGPADPQNKAGGGKPLTEGQSKSLVFASRMQEANDTLDKLAGSGTVNSVPGSTLPVVGSAINAVGGANNQQLVQAKRDFINAVLRRESGAAIASSEFDNADKQYFPQIGDGPAVIAQKKRNREIATRGIAADVPDAENRIGNVRGPSAPASSGGWSVKEVR